MISVAGVKKRYMMGQENVVYALRGVDLDVAAGEFMAIMGPSGSGKSTLMNILGCLDRPSEGVYTLAGQETSGMDDDSLARVRNRTIGFVFQTFNLLPKLTALQNVELPLMYRGVKPGERWRRAEESLSRVGLDQRMDHLPSQLSGGQQQRVAIARAIAGSPSVILADEPTGNLDSVSGSEVMKIFHELNDAGMTLLLVTHDEDVAAHARRVVRLKDGLIASDVRSDTSMPVPAEGVSAT